MRHTLQIRTPSKLVVQPYVSKTWKLLLPCVQETASCLTVFSYVLTIVHELASSLSAFPMGDVSGKMWSTRITIQQAGIYPKRLLGFTIYLASSPANIRIGALRYTSTACLPIYWRY